MLILIPLIVVVALVVLIAGGGDDSGKRASATTKPARPLPPIEGPKIEFEGLVYNVTDVHELDFDNPSDAPYLTNMERPPKGEGFLGVFLRVYNPTGAAATSAAGYLLEPTKNPGLAEQILPAESKFRFAIGAKVPGNGAIPAASGGAPGGLLLYPISTDTTRAQPFDFVIHTAKGGLANLRLPRVPKLKGHG
jgi:hypothetical protein